MADQKVYTWADLEKHNKRSDIWVAIDGRVFDVTKFLDEHPGGEEVLLEQAGQDATEAFEEIGHSDDARNLLKKWYIGNISDTVGGDPPSVSRPLRRPSS
ncbi:putative cytochrome b5 [Hyaloraphidium curvatum]|nr:putative cytochrome b5 [Hyaloraphidium curvatum]